MDIFDYAVEITLKHEGGYVEDKDGPTNFGICAKYNPGVDVQTLTRKQAIAIYRREYWEEPGFDRLTLIETAQQAFDFAVHAGVPRAVRTLQLAVNEAAGIPILKADGILGPKTAQAVNNHPHPDHLACTFKSLRIEYYNRLAYRSKFHADRLKGYIARVFA